MYDLDEGDCISEIPDAIFHTMIKEFKEFAFKGNVVDMAVGFILGAGFTGVVKAFVSYIIMPPLGMMMAGIDFKNLELTLREASEGKEAVVIQYGQFIDEAIAFTLLAFVVFIIVKKLIAGMHKEEAKEEASPPAPSKEEVLLTEIRDLLAKKG